MLEVKTKMLKRNNWFLPLLLSTCLMSAVANLVWAQEDGTDEADSSAPTISAEAAFARYCAPCHGDDGRGNGKLVFGLSRPAPDLTRLAMRNGGAFPRERVARLIDGRKQIGSHNREMPIWGDWFKLEAEEGFDGPAGDEAKIRKRIDDLVDLLQSMQEP
jgi:mono/diheme cytochrome c family protein